MDNKEDKCAECSQKERCGQVYERLGHAEGPNVTWPVILAFLVPIVVFIVVLAAVSKLLEGRVEGNLEIAVIFAAALAPTLAVIFTIRTVRKRFRK